MIRDSWRITSLTGLACALALADCKSGTESSAPPPAAGGAPPATAGATSTTTADTKPARSNTGKAVKPAAGFGNAQGRVLWNEKPAVGVKVQLCEKIGLVQSLFGIGGNGGCSGKSFASKTDAQGNYTIDKVPAGDYSLAVRIFDTDAFVYPSDGITAKYSIKEGETLDIRATSLFKMDVQVLSPRAGETVKTGTPELKWKPYTGAGTYEVSVAGTNNLEPQNITTASTSAKLTTPLLNGDYTWWITVRNANGIKLAETRSPVPFKVTGQKASATVTLTAPAAGTAVAGKAVKFAWQPHPQASSYQIYLALANAGTAILAFETVDGTSYTMTKPLEPGQYFWSITAVKGDKKVSASPLQSFRVN